MKPETDDEIKRLRRCINDLVGILALPAMWAGHEPPRVATTLLEALVRMLRLDFAYVRAGDAADGSPAEWIRSSDGSKPHIQAHSIGRALAPHLTGDAPATTQRTANPVDGGTASIAVFHLGLQDAVGVFVAGSRRPDFPTEIERLLLQVAANQAAIALQEARHVSQRRRTTEELERRVVERTAELKLLVDFVPQFIGVLEVDGTVRYVNRAGLDHLGRRLEELVHSDGVGATVYHAEDLDLVRAAVERALSQGVSAELEARLRRHDGVYPWFMIRYEPLRNEQGRILGWYWTRQAALQAGLASPMITQAPVHDGTANRWWCEPTRSLPRRVIEFSSGSPPTTRVAPRQRKLSNTAFEQTERRPTVTRSSRQSGSRR